jgi:biotin synthase
MLEVLSEFNPQPESVPINTLMAMKGTPMQDNENVDTFDLIRMIAVTRISIPKAKVRLSAGRTQMSKETQALCYFAGANSIFYGDKLLTAANPRANEDMKLLAELGLAPLAPNPAMTAPTADGERPRYPMCTASA